MSFSHLQRVYVAATVSMVAACGSTPAPDAKSTDTTTPPPPAASATSSESAAAAPVPEAPPAEQPFAKSILGTWDNKGAKLTFNSKGRMKMHWGDPPCFGTYSIEGNRLGVTYDAGTKGCTWGSPERIRVNEPSLDIGPVTYKRVDNKDDTSF